MAVSPLALVHDFPHVMKDILQEIVDSKRKELEQSKKSFPPSWLYQAVERRMASGDGDKRSMSEALRNSPTGIIAEFKRRSPSKGWIKEEGSPFVIPPSYERNGATALSVLTDTPYFAGSQAAFLCARPLVNIPMLRKDFIIDEYQVFEAKLIGADAILLIAADLTKDTTAALAHTAHELGLETLLEIHSEQELDHVCDDIDMVGVNNRHLGTFHTDVATSFQLASQLPAQFTLVSESGISQPQTVKQLRQAGFRGFLIGETFMKTPDPGTALRLFIQQLS